MVQSYKADTFHRLDAPLARQERKKLGPLKNKNSAVLYIPQARCTPGNQDENTAGVKDDSFNPCKIIIIMMVFSSLHHEVLVLAALHIIFSINILLLLKELSIQKYSQEFCNRYLFDGFIYLRCNLDF